MKTSARNQFFGTVKSIQTGAITDAIEIVIADGQHIVATVTQDSTEELALKVGSEVFALIKASDIILARQSEGARFSARNQFSGSVLRVQKGAVNSEVVMTMANNTLVVVVTNDSAERLNLMEGSQVTAIFKASNVIIGCPL